MAFDRIRPIALIFFHFLLVVLSHSTEYCIGKTSYDCSKDIFDSQENNEQSCNLTKVTTEQCSQVMFGDDDDKLGVVKLQSYQYIGPEGLNFLASFNLTLHNITWDRALIRYQFNNGTDHQICREFKIEGTVLPDKHLFFDCNWFLKEMSGQKITLEVMMLKGSKRSYKTFAFIVPENSALESSRNKISDWQIFSYLDITTPGKVLLHFQEPSLYGRFNYTVIASRDGENETKTVLGSPVAFELSSAGRTKFFIQPVGDTCKPTCLAGESPSILIEPASKAGLYATIIPLLIALALLAFIFFVFMPAKRKYQLIGIPKQTVLVMYKANHEFHSDMVRDLAQFLGTKNMEVLLDVDEIPKLTNPDPFTWCTNAVQHADVLMIVSSPSCCPNRGDGVYGKKVFEALEREIRNGALKKSCRLVRVLLPYCKMDDFPSNMNYTTFHVPQEMTSFINFVHNIRGSIRNFVLPFSKREGQDLLELNQKIYKTGTHMEGHHILESNRGSVASLTVVDELTPDESFMKPERSDSEGGAEYPNMQELKLLGEEDEDPVRQGETPLLTKLNMKL